MDTNEAMRHLAKRGIKVYKIGKDQFRVWDEEGTIWKPYRSRRATLRSDLYNEANAVWNGREIIKLARIYSSDNNQNTAMKSNVKHFDKGKNRSATRNNIQNENFDDIPQGQKTKEENRWNWD